VVEARKCCADASPEQRLLPGIALLLRLVAAGRISTCRAARPSCRSGVLDGFAASDPAVICCSTTRSAAIWPLVMALDASCNRRAASRWLFARAWLLS